MTDHYTEAELWLESTADTRASEGQAHATLALSDRIAAQTAELRALRELLAARLPCQEVSVYSYDGWIREADDQVPYHLDVNAPPLAVCDRCHLLTWIEAMVGTVDQMTQPNGRPCGGTFRAKGQSS